MNKFIKLTGLFALTLGLVTSCSENPGNTNNTGAPGVPTELNVGALTATTAELSWTAVEGAEGYNVAINQDAPVRVTTASYNATELTPETAYTWKVRAVRGDLASEWVAGPGFSTVAKTPTPAPTGLTADNVTATGVVLSWQHPYADKHEVVIGDAPAIVTTTAGYTAVGLQTLTEYIWKVRSQKDGEWSEWVEGENFTTLRAKLVNIHPNGQSGNYYGQNTLNYNFTITEYPLSEMPDGMFMEMDVIFSTTTMNLAKTEEFLDMPAGEYELNNTKGAGTFYLNRCWAGFFERGVMIDVLEISSGKVIIEGDRNNYTILVDIAWYNRDYTDISGEYHAEYTGPYNLPNPYYVVPGGDEINLNLTHSLQYNFAANAYFNNTFDRFLFKSGEPNTTHSYGAFGGDGWVFQTQINTALNSGEPLADGEYTISKTMSAGTAYAWSQNSGTRAFLLADGQIVESVPIVAGKFTSTFADGVYTLDLDLENEGGRKVTGTVMVSNTSPKF